VRVTGYYDNIVVIKIFATHLEKYRSEDLARECA
jgi:hypothetical protein